MDGGNSERYGLNFAGAVHELLDRGEGPTFKFPGNLFGPGKIWVDYAHQTNGFAFPRKLMVDAGVIASKGSNAHNRYRYECFRQIWLQGGQE